MIDPHQRCSVPALTVVEPGFVSGHDRAAPGGALPGEKGSEGAVGGAKQSIHAA
jgi:hypothetical protein